MPAVARAGSASAMQVLHVACSEGDAWILGLASRYDVGCDRIEHCVAAAAADDWRCVGSGASRGAIRTGGRRAAALELAVARLHTECMHRGSTEGVRVWPCRSKRCRRLEAGRNSPLKGSRGNQCLPVLLDRQVSKQFFLTLHFLRRCSGTGC